MKQYDRRSKQTCLFVSVNHPSTCQTIFCFKFRLFGGPHQLYLLPSKEEWMRANFTWQGVIHTWTHRQSAQLSLSGLTNVHIEYLKPPLVHSEILEMAAFWQTSLCSDHRNMHGVVSKEVRIWMSPKNWYPLNHPMLAFKTDYEPSPSHPQKPTCYLFSICAIGAPPWRWDYRHCNPWCSWRPWSSHAAPMEWSDQSSCDKTRARTSAEARSNQRGFLKNTVLRNHRVSKNGKRKPWTNQEVLRTCLETAYQTGSVLWFSFDPSASCFEKLRERKAVGQGADKSHWTDWPAHLNRLFSKQCIIAACGFAQWNDLYLWPQEDLAERKPTRADWQLCCPTPCTRNTWPRRKPN